MNLRRRQELLRQKQDAVRLQLAVTELDLAITFCRVAVTAGDQAKCHRNIANAERAYTAAAHCLRGNTNAARSFEIREKLFQLNCLLADCGSEAVLPAP